MLNRPASIRLNDLAGTVDRVRDITHIWRGGVDWRDVQRAEAFHERIPLEIVNRLEEIRLLANPQSWGGEVPLRLPNRSR
jgi:hypothetical protein